MTKEEIIEKLKEIVELNSQIKSLYKSREADEIEIAKRYNIEACNKERAQSAIVYQDQINALQMQVRAIQSLVENSIIGL